MTILDSLQVKKSKEVKSIAVLIDPDKFQKEEYLVDLIDKCNRHKIDFIFVGGSLLVSGSLKGTIAIVKKRTNLPVILFPGSSLHIDNQADAILLLSLISGRNPDLLIGQHVSAAPIIKKANIEVLSTGYILVGNNATTTVAHISQTSPIPSKKPEIAVCTAMAGEMLGMRLIYLDAGSGASEVVPNNMIHKVAKSIQAPLIVGGGINTDSKAAAAFNSGADTIVLGTILEHDAGFISEVASIKDQLNSKHS